jgi:ubiquinone/menaquinone biosynthesis C-methylase UbiE
MNCHFLQGDVRKLNFENNTFDVIYTERCLINIRNWAEQKLALKEIHRVLKTNGRYVMIECFTDGHNNYNKARTEIGLPEIKIPEVNLFFDKLQVMTELEKMKFQCIGLGSDYADRTSWNFLSSHYFIARVLHAAITDKLVRNSEFVKFFLEALPQNIGNYSPIQGFIFRKI